MLLGIDYGRNKMGFAFANGFVASPLEVIHYKNIDEFWAKFEKVLKSENWKTIIVGISEGKMADEIAHFVQDLGKHTTLPIEIFDETLSSQDAQKLSLSAGIGPKKRKKMEDAYAAAVMLQAYLDSRL